MILAAGLGTRLRPMTDHTPKALLEYGGMTLLEYVVRKLAGEGFTDIVVNVHHHAEMVMEYVERHRHFGSRITFSDERDALLDTGGGIARASGFFGDQPILVYNVDIRSSISVSGLYRAHLEAGAPATLAVKERVTSRSLLMDGKGMLRGWRDNRTGETILTGESDAELVPIAFSGIHVLDPDLFRLVPGPERFPIVPFYLELAKTRPVRLYRHDGDTWTDMGRKESYESG